MFSYDEVIEREVCKVCEGDKLQIWREFSFSNGSEVIVYEICGVCCRNMYKWNGKFYYNDKEYGFEKNNFKEIK